MYVCGRDRELHILKTLGHEHPSELLGESSLTTGDTVNVRCPRERNRWISCADKAKNQIRVFKFSDALLLGRLPLWIANVSSTGETLPRKR
ncbi:hypothetical protein CYMTET_19717 [Cymbomonas tetramitiformis]|uniref:Uncharacterized protein n=1 Tax=Cymbomonas tetramitiformis TaxID=36881 RepID=A0AAE0G5F4_9CHLO|nr:hypothetical protein CYMTET_19717 [Cymbomonas tetramitiformis]